MKRTVLFAATLLSFAAWSPRLQAGTISSFTTGTAVGGNVFWGESFTTPAGGPWNSITFNFFSDAGATTPTAPGDAFLLSSQYLGLPTNLSSGTPGFIAESTGNAGGIWTFAAGVTLSPNTEYWIYDDAAGVISGIPINGTSSQRGYASNSSGSSFAATNGVDNFNLSGTAAPEPGTVGLAGAALFSLALWSRYKRIVR